MRRFKLLALLALVAGTTSGCATATRSGNGLAAIRSRPRAEVDAPPQHLVTTTRPDAAASGDHAGIFARPDGLSKFFPGLHKDVQKDVAEAPKVAKTTPRGSWLVRRLRGMGQGTPTSLTYSTAPKPGGDRKPGPGEVSILPVALNIPTDHPRDGEVTTVRAESETPAEAGPDETAPAAEAPAAEALTPLEPANPESFSTAAREVSPDPAPAPSDQPAPEASAPVPAPAPAASPEEPAAPAPAPAPSLPEPASPEPSLPEPASPEPSLPEPASPEPKVETPPVAPEPKQPEPAPEPVPTLAPEPAPTPAPEAAAAPEPAPSEAARPSAPTPRPTADAPATEAATPAPDPRERPRLPSIRPRPVASGAAAPTGPRKLAPPPVAVPASAAPVIPSKTIPVAASGKAAGQGERTGPIVAARSRVQDRNVRAAKVQAEASRALGLPDPTLPSSYYRSDAPPVQGDGTVVETAATAAPADPAVALVNGPCPHCGHDPHWRPSLQRFGRRIFGLGEFAPPQP